MQNNNETDSKMIDDLFDLYKKSTRYELILNKLNKNFPSWNNEELIYEGFKIGDTSYISLVYNMKEKRGATFSKSKGKSEIELEIEDNQRKRDAEPYIFKSNFADIN